MRFLAFVTNDAECERIMAILETIGVIYDKKTVSDGQRPRGHMLYVPEADFDRADEQLGTPGHDMSFSLLADHKAYRDEANERQRRVRRHSIKQLRRFAFMVGTVGLLYLLYVIIQNV